MTANTVAIGAALVLVGVVAGMNVPTVEAQRGDTYAISASSAHFTWRMNRQTGQVSVCMSTSASSYPSTMIDSDIVCSKWKP